MIIGHTSLILNQATLCKIVEEYLNNRLLDRQDHITVVSVHQNPTLMFTVGMTPSKRKK